MKGLWLLPTRRRFDKLQRFLDKATENGMQAPGVCLVQADELVECRADYDAIRKPANWRILPTRGEGLADKCREVWTAVEALDWVGLACDDLVPQSAQWEATLLAAVSGRNIVTCDDGKQGNLRMSGITIFSGGVLRAMGYMFPPHFWHTYADNVWEDLGRGADCWTYVHSVLIEHDHPFRGGQISQALIDDTGARSYGQQQRDQQAYALWIAQDRAACIERIRSIP